MSEIKLNFGKYKDYLLSDICTKDIPYCKWLLNQPFTDKSIKEYLKEYLPDKPVMNWGKYKNKTLDWIYAQDYKYILYLLNNQFVKDKCPELLKELEKYPKKAIID